MRLIDWKKRKRSILETLHKRAVEDKKQPIMGFRELRRETEMGTNPLKNRLQSLVEDEYVATTNIGAYKRYYITPEGIDREKSLKQIEELLVQQKPDIKRIEPEKLYDPSATAYLKNVSPYEYENIILPAWNTFVSEVRKKLREKNCEIAFVGTIKRFKKPFSMYSFEDQHK